MANPQSIPILQSPLEGLCKIKSIKCFKFSLCKYLTFVFLSIISIGIVPLFSYWNLDFYILLVYVGSSLEDSTHFLITNWDFSESIVKKEKDPLLLNSEIWFELRFLKYFYSPAERSFKVLEFPFEKEISNEIQKKYSNGIDILTRSDRRDLYGSGIIEIPTPSGLSILAKNVLSPYTFLQVLSIGMWILEEYYLFSVVIVFLTFFSSFYSIFTIKKSYKKIQSIAYFLNYCQIQTPSGKTEISSQLIVPGDILILEKKFRATCDMVLLQGEALVNESNLTGESHLQRKFAVSTLGSKSFDRFKDSKCIIYEGSYVRHTTIRSKGDQEVTALAIRTGISTLRGQIIRSILFPSPPKLKFFEQSLKFLLMISLLSLIGFMILLPKFLEFLSDQKIVYKFLDIFTITIPPSLPCALAFGIAFAINFLQRNKISTFLTNKLIIGGVVDTVCFDKTGTLTKSELDLQGIKTWKGFDEQELISKKGLVSILNSTNMFNDVINLTTACVSISMIEGEFQGDPVDVTIFKSLKGILSDEEPDKMISITGNKIQIHKIFDFNSEKQMMSVIAEIDDLGLVFISKGAPEVIRDLCLETSLPPGDRYYVDSMSKQGFRTISIAFKRLNERNFESISEEKISELKFAGFLIFENKIKSDSTFVIDQLRNADFNIKIISGDNLLTSINAAKECGILRKANMSVIDFEEFPKKRFLVRNEKITEEVTIRNRNESTVSIEMQSIKESIILENPFKKAEENNYVKEFIILLQRSFASHSSFAITGKAFSEVLKLKTQHFVFPKLLWKCEIFGRMKPNQKAQLIEELQLMGRRIAMCGDGSNDASALKQSEIGLAISDGDAAFYAPFSASDSSIRCIVDLIKGCRSGLWTSFQAFKLICTFSLVQFTTVIILFYHYSELTDNQYIFINLFLQMPFMCTFAMTDPCDILSKIKPQLSLFSLEHVISVLGAVFIQIIAQTSAIFYLNSQEFYKGDSAEIDYFNKTSNLSRNNVDSAVLFLFSNFIYLGVILIYSLPNPYRKPFYSNIIFTGNIAFTWLLCCLITIFPQSTSDVFTVPKEIPEKFLIGLVLLAHFWIFMFLAFEVLVCKKFISEIINQRKKIKNYQNN